MHTQLFHVPELQEHAFYRPGAEIELTEMSDGDVRFC